MSDMVKYKCSEVLKRPKCGHVFHHVWHSPFKRILSYWQFIWERLIESPWTLNDLTFIMHMMCFKNIRLFLSSEVYQLGEFQQNFAFRQKQMAAEFFLRWLHQVCKSFTPLKLKNKLDWNSEVHVFLDDSDVYMIFMI